MEGKDEMYDTCKTNQQIKKDKLYKAVDFNEKNYCDAQLLINSFGKYFQANKSK